MRPGYPNWLLQDDGITSVTSSGLSNPEFIHTVPHGPFVEYLVHNNTLLQAIGSCASGAVCAISNKGNNLGGMRVLKENKWWIILVWLTVLVFVVVSRIDSTLRNSTTLNLAPITSTIPVQVSTDPTSGSEYAVPVGNNSVWIVRPNLQQVIIITRSSDGTIKATSGSYTLSH